MNRRWVPLNPLQPLETPKGFGYALFILDQGQEHNIQWLVCVAHGDNAGQFWVVDNAEVRACTNWTLKRDKASEVKPR